MENGAVAFLRDHQLNVMLFLVGVCLLIAFLVSVAKTISLRRKISLILLSIGGALLLIMDRFAYIYRGDVSRTGYYMVRISNFFVFFLVLFLLYGFNLYLKDLFLTEGKKPRLPRRIKTCDYLIFLGALMLAISRIGNLYYYFDETNHYVRGRFFYMCYAFPVIVLLIQFTVIFACYKELSRYIRVSLVLFTTLPLIGSIVQIYAYGLSIINISMVLTVVLLFIFTYSDLNIKVRDANRREVELLKEQQNSIRTLFDQTAQALSGAIDAKDEYTHGHSLRVAEYSKRIAALSGKDEQECRYVYYSALLHDVGKIGVPDSIIKKEGKLTSEEFDFIKQHPVKGYQILSTINQLPYLSVGAHYHHERYDGKGYPEGLKGEAIPDIARIIAVADAYDAMTSKRSYRAPIPQQKVREEIVKGLGTQFDPNYGRMMLHLIDEDTEYLMKEREDSNNLTGDVIDIGEFRSVITEGIALNGFKTTLTLKSIAKESHMSEYNLPTLLLFDSLDARTHDKDNKAGELYYLEYAEVDFDGRTRLFNAREKKEEVLRDDEVSSIDRRLMITHGTEYEVTAYKIKDHVSITISDGYKVQRTIIALPDANRYVYMGITGANCVIKDINVSKADTKMPEESIERIAEEVSYIKDCPRGDLDNIQVNGWRMATTKGVPVSDGMKLKFHSFGLPTARLVWHCPSFVIFYSDDGTVTGDNYRELGLIRMDGESWEADDNVSNSIEVVLNENFKGWEAWKEEYRKGIDVEVSINRRGENIILTTENLGLSIKSTSSINVYFPTIYVAISGDQCAVTDIKVRR